MDIERTRAGARPGDDLDPAHVAERESAEQVRDVSDAAERHAGSSIEELATGLDHAEEQPGYGREGN
jgi:hypothetical protein